MAVEVRASLKRARWKAGAHFGALALLLGFAVVLGTAVGQVHLPLLETFLVIAARIFGVEADLPATSVAIIWSVRLPRVLVAGLVGFGLAVSGAAMQGLFRNPLASPGVTGVSSGASVGAAVAIFFQAQYVHAWLVPLAAFAGALAALAVVYGLSTRGGKTDVSTLLLAGLAVGAFFSAIISALYHFVPDGVLRQIVYWLMGNFSGMRWDHAAAMAPFILLGSAGLLAFARDLNAFALGEEEASSMGVDVEAVKRWVLLLVALVTGASISVSGMIGFVGLIVPHAMRFLVGPDHRRLIPASGLGGASFLIVCDLLSRTLFSPIELRPGIVTSLFGVPFFVSLLLKHRQRVGWS